MTEQNPITPPLELIKQWITEGRHQDYCSSTDYAIAQAAQWGYEQRGASNEAELQKARDEELEACCEVLARELICDGKHVATDLRAVRRPKPLSLKEQALQALDYLCVNHTKATAHENTIRRALEQLDD